MARLLRVRGWIGKTTGMSRLHRPPARRAAGRRPPGRPRCAAGAASARRSRRGSRPSSSRIVRLRRPCRGSCSSVSIITLPTRKTFSVGDALAPQVLHAALLGAEQQVADRVGQDAVDLLGHRRGRSCAGPASTWTSLTPSLTATSPQAIVLLTSPTTSTASGLLLQHDRLEGLHDLGGLHGVRCRRADAQVDVRLGNAELAEEQVAHPLVVVLAGVDQHRLDRPCVPRYASISGAIFMKFGRAPTTLMILKVFRSPKPWFAPALPSRPL